jgi:hypothetical protein
MNCYFCNKATMSIPATGTCAKCQSPSCSHPSGRPDFRFHGERCRYPHCNAFLCKYDTHDHSGSGSGHGGGLPQNFPLLSVNISLPAMSVAEATFGHSKDVPLSHGATASLTEYVRFFTPIWYRRAILGRRPLFESLRGDRAGGRSEVRLIRSDYFDSLRVAHLALNAAVMLFSAWRGLRAIEQYSLGLPESVIKRINQFGDGELPQLAALSPRLEAFVTEALSLRATLRAGKIEALDFRIREVHFTPSATLLDMPAVLNLADRVRVLGSSEREGGADMSA